VLKRKPLCAEAFHLMGVLHSQRGDRAEAVRYIEKAARLSPRNAVFQSNLGLALHLAGKPEDAEAPYRRAVALEPRFAEALYGLGNVLAASKRPAEAAECYRAAVRENPQNGAAHNNLGNCLRALGKRPEAARSFEEAIRCDPSDAEAWTNLGVVQAETGDLDQAILSYTKALAIEPRAADTLYNLACAFVRKGMAAEAANAAGLALEARPDFPDAFVLAGSALKNLGHYDLAADCYRGALRLRSGDPEALSGLGNALEQQGDMRGARECYEEAVHLDASRSQTHCNLGGLCLAEGFSAEAEAHLRRAIELDRTSWLACTKLGSALEQRGEVGEGIYWHQEAVRLNPRSSMAQCNLGNALRRFGRDAEAELHIRQALELDPGHWQAFNNLGAILKDRGRAAEAVELYRQALEHKPDAAAVWLNLGLGLADLRHQEEALRALLRAEELDRQSSEAAAALAILRQQLCEWPQDIEAQWRRMVEDQVSGTITPAPFQLVSVPSTPAEQLASARRCAAIETRGVTPGTWRHVRLARGRLRVGYTSAKMRDHAGAHLVAELLELHDRGRFEIFGYSHGPADASEVRARLIRAFDRFADVTEEAHEETAQRIYDDGVNILVDLNGLNEYRRPRVLANRAAPIQVSYLGYPATTGAEFMDYLIADPYVIPHDHVDFYSEKIAWLPHCYQANDRKRRISEHVPTRAECGLPENGAVFCSFNNTYKINPETFASWMRIVKATDQAVLWLIGDNESAVRNLRSEAAARGVEPDRLVFAPRCGRPEHLARHKHADLFLDTFPCTAHATASDALWMGVPVLTMPGETFASRVAGSLLLAVGLPEMIAGSRPEFEALAIRLAHRPDELAALRAKLAANQTTAPLFDTPRLARYIEAAYERMWSTFAEGKPPDHFRIDE
jgi:predicted O-linked N-acetylglucosamine transferase (SPINDLY family)